MPRLLPPVSGQFVKGRSGNPLGQPKRKQTEDLLRVAILFADTLAKAYYQKGAAQRRISRIKKVLNEK